MQLCEICRYQYQQKQTDKKRRKAARQEHSLEGYNDSRIIAAADQPNGRGGRKRKKYNNQHDIKTAIKKKAENSPYFRTILSNGAILALLLNPTR